MKSNEEMILPDEGQYPAGLTEEYELLEVLSSTDEDETLLIKNRQDGTLAVAKCYRKTGILYEYSEPEGLRKLNAFPMPRYLAEYRNDDMRCVVREFIPGSTLEEVAEKRKFRTDEIADIGISLCDQLEALHAQQPSIIHRDIKPQNIIVKEDGSVVLIDFGIARTASDKGNESDTIPFGTKGFAPPEQYGFSQTDNRSDIYSLGVLLNWLLHGKAEALKNAANGLERIIERCTAFDPENRYRNIAQVRKALLQEKPENRRKRKLLLGAGMILLISLCIFTVFCFARGRQGRIEFEEPLVEQAVRLALRIGEKDRIKSHQLREVKGLYVVADKAFSSPDDFYPAINQWYAEGKPTRGNIQKLDDLKMLPNLEQVCFVAQDLEDISALSELKNINKVEFKHDMITDISVLPELKHLTSVGLNGNPIQDISPLARCANLAFLDLCDVRTYDAAVIAQLGNLDYLDLSNPTNSYEYLGEKRILSLRLAWTGLTSLEVLDRVSRLEGLDIAHTAVTELSPLLKHPGLRSLNIAACPIKDPEILLQMPMLEEVIISKEMMPMINELGEIRFTVRTE